MSMQVVDENQGLGLGDAPEQLKPVITASIKNYSLLDANRADLV
jgi:hypothetical protein